MPPKTLAAAPRSAKTSWLFILVTLVERSSLEREMLPSLALRNPKQAQGNFLFCHGNQHNLLFNLTTKVELEIGMARYVALCGYPKAGKSEVQRIISERYGFEAVDDSEALRNAAKILYDLTDWHVLTQEGKATLIQVGEETMAVRKALGDLGKYFEATDRFHFPRLAIKRANQKSPDGRFVFASVRRDQPQFYRETGEAIIIEVRREGCSAQNDFDEYTRDYLDFSIENVYNEDAPEASRRRLAASIADILDPIFPVIGEMKAA